MTSKERAGILVTILALAAGGGRFPFPFTGTLNKVTIGFPR